MSLTNPPRTNNRSGNRPDAALTQMLRRRRKNRIAARQHQTRTLFGISTSLIASVAGLIALAVVGTIGGAVGLYMFYARQLPPPSAITQVREAFETTRLYDRSGKQVLYEVVDPAGDRQSLALASMPRDLINATVAIEDRSFYTNPGFDIRGIGRAIFIALAQGQIQGGSTITQQLVKNTLIDPDQRARFSQDRKIKEIILAAEISRLYSKDQILEWYMNTNFYGNLAYGIGAASKVYFGKDAALLSLSESAMLAAIPQNPALNPIDNPTLAKQRQLVVLDYMVRARYVTREQADQAGREPIILQPSRDRYNILAPHFSLWARSQAEELLDAQGLNGARLVLGGGLKIYTTLDLDLQLQMECSGRAYMARVSGRGATSTPNAADGSPCAAADYLPTLSGFALDKERRTTNAASIVIKPETGEVIGMMGSLDYNDAAIGGSYNAAVQGLRQPASTFKPFVYVTAFSSPENPYTPATLVWDIPTTFNSNGTLYTPRNEDNDFHGPMTVRTALANSYNIPTVRVLSDISAQRVIRVARQMGLSSLNAPPEQTGLALALGSSEVSLIDLTYAYTVFANMGTMAGRPDPNPRPGFRSLDPVGVLRIEDRDGKILWEFGQRGKTFTTQSVLRDSLAYLMNDILSDDEARVPAFGADNALDLSFPAAVKTGTTNDNRDAWTVGYTSAISAGVWVGNNDNTSMGDDVSGSTAAAPMWNAIMEYYHRRERIDFTGWDRPATVTEASVCTVTGLLPTTACDRVKEVFFKDAATSTVPTQPDIYWKLIKVNARNGLIATSATPPNYVQDRQFFDYPPEALAWAKTRQLPLIPTEYDTAAASTTNRAGAILTPVALDRLRGSTQIRGSLDTRRIASYNLEYGAGINPTQWVSIPDGEPDGRGDDVLLGIWDTAGLDGLYTLRLSLTLQNGTFEPYTMQVTVDNLPPLVALTTPTQDQQIDLRVGLLKIQADVSDNFEVAAVEFFRDDQLIKRIEQGSEEAAAGWSVDWLIDSAGAHTFYATAIDSAGNVGKSEPIRVFVR